MYSKNIPIINMAQLHRNETLRVLDNACRNLGAFQLINHGVDNTMIHSLHQTTQTFFKLPSDKKRQVSRSKETPWGFYDRELTKNTQDWKEIFDYGPSDEWERKPQWPTDLPLFQSTVTDMYKAFEQLSFKILKAISLNLGLAKQQLATHFAPAHSSFLRLNYYPTCPQPENPSGMKTPSNGYLGVNHHTDAGVLTILLQDKQPGLEIFHDGQWHLVEAREDTLLVHLGDVMQVWSNDRYQAPVHRVVSNQHAERFSVPFFFNTANSTNYKPLHSVVDSANPPRYHSINWGEFRDKRAKGDYADYGEEVQISHYRIKQEQVS